MPWKAENHATPVASDRISTKSQSSNPNEASLSNFSRGSLSALAKARCRETHAPIFIPLSVTYLVGKLVLPLR